jgi:hypothetical protein
VTKLFSPSRHSTLIIVLALAFFSPPPAVNALLHESAELKLPFELAEAKTPFPVNEEGG